MAGSIQNRWTYAVTCMQMQFGETDLALGSAFFWKALDKIFLITNWHNLTGRDPDTQQPRSKTGAVPDRISFLVYKRVSEPNEKGGFSMEVAAVEVRLYEGDFERSRWIEHPVHHRAVDVAAIDVTSEMTADRIHFLTADALEHDADVQPHVPEDAFIVGYPLGISTGLPVPVWKRGSIATEPSLDPGDLPRVFVDTATREGMSGSLVLVRHILLGPYSKKDGTKTNNLYATVERILGVYSGRLGEDQLKAQLGIVWKRRVIDEVVAGGCPGQIGMQ
jgi:hypothetical protein